MPPILSTQFRTIKHEIPCQHIREYPAAMSQNQEDTLKLAVNQYIPNDNLHPQPGDVTILAAHANGLPKELYEPLWEEIYTRSKDTELRIRAIWIADVAHQGQSGVINEGLLGNDPNWFDHARDLLHLVNVKRAEMTRPIVGIGHSMGGTHLVQLSLMHPRLFHTLVLFDPAIQRPQTQLLGDSNSVFNHEELISGPTRLSINRRDKWPSREKAAEAFTNNVYYQSWDKRVLQRWIEYGLRDLPTPPQQHPPPKQSGVTLTTPVSHEVTGFARPVYNHIGDSHTDPINRTTHADLDPSLITSGFPFYRPEPSLVFEQLPHVRPSIMYIFGGRSHMCMPALRLDKLKTTGNGVGGSGGATIGRVREILFPDYGHLLPLEAVDECARVAVSCLGPEMKRWEAEESAFNKQWNEKSMVEKSAALDKHWKKQIRSSERNRESRI